MNRITKTLLTILGVIAVLTLSYLASMKNNVKEITVEDYNKIVEKGGYIYYGKLNNEESIENVAESLDEKVYVLSSAEEVKGLKEDTLYKYEKGKEVFSYNGELTGYKLSESLMKEGLMDREYLTITFDDYKKIIASEGYNFMFIGSETCSWCSKFKTVINEALKDNNFNVYYIDLSSMTQDEYNALIATDSYMSENEWGTPLNLLYKDGKRINVLNGYVPEEELIKFLKENKVI